MKQETLWGYDDDNGPDVWADLRPEYRCCGFGKHQSPIDIVDPTHTRLPPITFTYQSVPLNIRNTGRTIEVVYPEGSWIQVGGTTYRLLQFHFHTPSEHTVDGKFAELELHLVHESADGTLAVIGVLIESGATNAAFAPFWDLMPAVSGESVQIEEVVLNAYDLLPEAKHTYRYIGSLTTPPCSEGVKWLVLTTPIQLSPAQIAAFRAIFNRNNRPVQPLNARELLTDK